MAGNLGLEFLLNMQRQPGMNGSFSNNLSHIFGSYAGGAIDYDSIVDDYMKLHNGNADPDQHRRNLITYYLMGIGGMLVCCLGLVGNILSLLVLTQRTMRLSTNSYLAALAVCDCLVLIFTMVLLSKDVHKPVQGQSSWKMDEGLYPHIFPYVHPLAFTFQVTSIWLTLSFTVDRYIMICHPFKAEPFCTISRARKVIAVLYLSAIVFNIPKFFEYETVVIPLPMQNATKIGYDLTSFGRSHVFREMYHSWFYVAFVCGIPFLTLAVLNAFLMHAVRLSWKRGKEINVADKKRNDTTIMLIGVVVVFFICQMPALVSRTVWAFEHDPKAFRRLPLYTLNEFGNFLIILNSAINIVPYYFFGRKFRKEFWHLFCHCLLRYGKFQKISRSFSLTVLDHPSRRASQASHLNNTVLICDGLVTSGKKMSGSNASSPMSGRDGRTMMLLPPPEKRNGRVGNGVDNMVSDNHQHHQQQPKPYEQRTISNNNKNNCCSPPSPPPVNDASCYDDSNSALLQSTPPTSTTMTDNVSVHAAPTAHRTSIDSATSWMTDDSGGLHQQQQHQSKELKSEEDSGDAPLLNGDVSSGVRKCLLYNTIKTHPVAYGDEEF